MSEATSMGPEWDSVTLSLLFPERTFPLSKDKSPKPGQNRKPKEEMTAAEFRDHSGHRPQLRQSHAHPGSRVRGHGAATNKPTRGSSTPAGSHRQ